MDYKKAYEQTEDKLKSELKDFSKHNAQFYEKVKGKISELAQKTEKRAIYSYIVENFNNEDFKRKYLETVANCFFIWNDLNKMQYAQKKHTDFLKTLDKWIIQQYDIVNDLGFQKSKQADKFNNEKLIRANQYLENMVACFNYCGQFYSENIYLESKINERDEQILDLSNRINDLENQLATLKNIDSI